MGINERLHQRETDRLREIVQHPEWYNDLKVMHKVRALGIAAVQGTFGGSITQAAERAKDNLVRSFEQLLAEEVVRLGRPGEDLEDWDAERQPVDKIVIHHTSRESGIRKEQLNAMHLLRLYVPRYQSEGSPVVDTQGSPQPIYSGHFDGQGKQVFYAYHWLVKPDGQVERLLEDSAIGWQAGDWGVNCRSVAICIDDDLTTKRPTDETIHSIVDIISREYPDIEISPTSLVGHREVSQTKTICPGSEFLGGWKLELLQNLAR